jgi:hypothetical protein
VNTLLWSDHFGRARAAFCEFLLHLFFAIILWWDLRDLFATRRMQGWLYHGTLIVIWAQDVAGYDDRFGPRLLLFTAVKIVLSISTCSL